MLTITCPVCNSRNVRSSLSRTLGERVVKAFGFFQIRCKDCDARFTRQIWDISNALYARCPRCYRLDLSTWSLDYYRAPIRWLVYLKLGANAHRCEYCRHNFVSFRPCKIRYDKNRKTPSTTNNPRVTKS
jgi:DNA-directed RNA polymerase subunit RPC12/RpoP